MFASIIFIFFFLVATVVFYRKVRKITRSIKLGKDITINDNKPLRWKKVLFIAIGQEKMLQRPIAALLHIFVYAGFIIVNIEMINGLIIKKTEIIKPKKRTINAYLLSSSFFTI